MEGRVPLAMVKFPHDKASRVLMDWKGVFPKAYGFQRKSCNILIFNAEEA